MVLLVVAVGAMYVLLGSEQVPAGEEIPIYHGITYASVELEPTDESQGFAHLVRVDLSAEGIQPYMTSVDSSLVEHGYQYRLQHPWRVARRERLAVAVNGALFHRSGRWYLPGQRATGTHTVVADGEISHVHPHGYLMWLDGGGSTAMHIGRDAAGGVGGTIFGGWRLVATHIGLHARPLQPEYDR